MYGLPSQTKSDWADTLARIIELHPEHISCYGLKLEPGTRMYKEYKDSVIMPDDVSSETSPKVRISGVYPPPRRSIARTRQINSSGSNGFGR